MSIKVRQKMNMISLWFYLYLKMWPLELLAALPFGFIAVRSVSWPRRAIECERRAGKRLFLAVRNALLLRWIFFPLKRVILFFRGWVFFPVRLGI
ncbi:MAG: hypothetical protein H2172_07410 [Opitutus sp.]|nr:hypothetical protein [Opitutus sp.]MCS6301156.1 hypothetical protein [Opitutus sp.]